MKNSISIKATTEPDLLPVATGDTLKVFEVNGKAGMVMPRHYATEEALVAVKKGSSKLRFEDDEWTLSEGDTYLIPAGRIHSLKLLDDFKALVVMPLKSDITFDPLNEITQS